jgi:hypothetical protein
MTALDASQRDELREALARTLLDATTGYGTGKAARDVDLFDFYADAILPVVTAWHETQARARAAEELRKAADAVRHQLPGFIGRVDTADAIDDRADALAAGYRAAPA